MVEGLLEKIGTPLEQVVTLFEKVITPLEKVVAPVADPRGTEGTSPPPPIEIQKKPIP